MMSMEKRNTQWTPFKAISKADEFLDDLMVPAIGKEVTKEYGLDFSNLMNAESRQLEEFLTMFGGYKAYLESQLAHIDANKSAIEAAFDEGYATAVYKIASTRESEGQKKLTREEIRGAVLDTYSSLKELRREVIEQDTVYKKVAGLLNAYKAAYDAVSRIVALRTFGKVSSM